MWGTDFTMACIDGEGLVYFTAYTGIYSRKIRVFPVSGIPGVEEMLKAPDNALLKEFPDLLIKPNNESQLISHGYIVYRRLLFDS